MHDYPAWPDPPGMLWSEEAATVDQMIRSFTANGARADFLERTTGSIEVGKSADLIVLDRNLFQVSPDTIFRRQRAARRVPGADVVRRRRALRTAG